MAARLRSPWSRSCRATTGPCGRTSAGTSRSPPTSSSTCGSPVSSPTSRPTGTPCCGTTCRLASISSR
eukprot:11159445-Lingulodinium_polyedra.AAC.1